MNAFEKLSLEYDGILGTIDGYTGDSIVINHLSKLKDAINRGDYDAICYCLDEIILWYKNNIGKIRDNGYVTNLDSHKRNMQLLIKLRSDLDPADCIADNTQLDLIDDRPLIFISHKSDDKKYGDAIRNFIIGLGVKNDQLIYTSHPLNKIPLDANIYDYLRKHINSNIFMIVLWSNSYLDSPACLNEMGALWVTQADYTNLYVPSFSFGNPKYHECAIDTRKMGALLNGDQHCKAGLIELKNKIQSLFGLKDNEQQSAFLIDETMKLLKETN